MTVRTHLALNPCTRCARVHQISLWPQSAVLKLIPRVQHEAHAAEQRYLSCPSPQHAPTTTIVPCRFAALNTALQAIWSTARQACQKRVRRQSERLSGVCWKAPPPPTRVATCEQRVFFPPLLLVLQTHRSQLRRGRPTPRTPCSGRTTQRTTQLGRSGKRRINASAAQELFAIGRHRPPEHQLQRPAASPEVRRPTASAAAQRSSE